MTDDTHQSDGADGPAAAVGRRRILTALGAAAFGGLAGCAASHPTGVGGGKMTEDDYTVLLRHKRGVDLIETVAIKDVWHTNCQATIEGTVCETAVKVATRFGGPIGEEVRTMVVEYPEGRTSKQTITPLMEAVDWTIGRMGAHRLNFLDTDENVVSIAVVKVLFQNDAPNATKYDGTPTSAPPLNTSRNESAATHPPANQTTAETTPTKN